MRQGDQCWHYSPGPKGAVRRVALVVGLHDSGDTERVNLFIFATGRFDDVLVKWNDAVPVRYDYTEGGDVPTPFCAPMRPPWPMRPTFFDDSPDMRVTEDTARTKKPLKGGVDIARPSKSR